MSKKKITWIFVLIAAIAGISYGVYQYTRGNEKLTNAKPDFSIRAADLIKEFETADSASENKYQGKVIEVSGIITNSALENFTISLGDPGKLSAVICELDTSFRKTASVPFIGTQATIKGRYVGHIKDDMMGLGIDINLNRCIVIQPKND